MTANSKSSTQGSERKAVFHSGLPIDAVIFDLDGVVTDTATAHAIAWKRMFDEYLRERERQSKGAFEPFDCDADYLTYVDGKPRYEGVETFLASRGIELPFGDPDDDPAMNTICGLGNRKNVHFLAWLKNNDVSVYPSTLRLIYELRRAGIRTGIFTASRNGKAVLASTRIGSLFDAAFDGVDLARLGLPGKPEPAMLYEITARLNAVPQHTAVIEDSLAGILAAAKGGFGLVIGVNRHGHSELLQNANADIVVSDLKELSFLPDLGFVLCGEKT